MKDWSIVWAMNEAGGDGSYDRGSFACVGSDDRIHSVVARITRTGALVLSLDDGQPVTHVVKGRYKAVVGGKRIQLRCDHPDAP